MGGNPQPGERQDPGPYVAASGNRRLLPRALALEGMMQRCGDTELVQGSGRAL